MKKIMKRSLAFMLIFIFILSAAGCGKGGKADSTQARKEFYYVPEYKKLDLDVNYLSQEIAVGDSLYMFGSQWNEETGESKYLMYQYNLLTDECIPFPMELDTNSSIQQVSVDSQGNFLMIVNRYEPVGAENKQTDTADEESEGLTADSGTVAVTSKAVTAVVAETGEEYAEAVEYQNYTELWEVSAADGKIINQMDIKAVFDNPDNFWVQYMLVDAQDIIYLSDGNSSIYLIDKTGQKLGSISLDGWIDGLFVTKEGNVYVNTWGNSGQEIKPVNKETKSLGEAISAENLIGNGYSYNQKYYKGMDKGIVVSSSSGVFTYDFETDSKEELFEWLDADINSDDVSEIGQLADGRFWAILHDYSEEENEYSLVYLTKTPASEMAQKEELVYGTMWLNQSVRKNIINFNKSSSQYHISVKEYGADDYSTGMTQFNNDITSGSGPDIIDVSNIDYKQYASKGVLEDMYPYMEKDGINKADYLENVFKAYEDDGKLYGIIPQFYISTTVAKASKVGDKTGWTLSEMLAFAEKSNAENIFQYGSRMSIFYYCIYNNIDEFINWETGECSFNGEDFIRVLEFANKFPEEPNYNDTDEGTSEKLRADKLLLMQTSISSVQEYQMMNGLFGEKVTYIGYPNSEQKGNLIQPTNGSVALNAKSKHKDGAWEYIKTLLSDEYQDSLISEHGGWGFPIKISALDKQFEKDMTPEYYEDENGQRLEQIKTSWGYDDFNIDIYAATQEEVDAVKEIIYSAERTAGSVNEELTNIITEETEAFFKGQKSAKDTADIIQNRIQIYVNENR